MARRASLSVFALMLALAACNATSPLVWSAADQDDDEDKSNEETPREPAPMDAGEEPPPPPPPSKMDGGVMIAEPTKPPCGTGPGCDPTNMGGETCETLGAGSGRLLCDPITCLFEVGLCVGLPDDASVGRPCGTGPGCNTRDLGGETCASLNMGNGALRCDPETCELDTSLCSGGNGIGGNGAVFGGNNFGGNNFGGGGDAGFFGGNFFGNGDADGGTFFGGNFFGGNEDGGTFFGGSFFGGDGDGGTFFGGGFFGGGFFGGGGDAGFFGGGFFGGDGDEDPLDAGMPPDPLDAGMPDAS